MLGGDFFGGRGRPHPPSLGLRDVIPSLIQAHLDAIRDLCRRYGVARLELFGSAAADAFDPARSDVDFLVTYPPGYDVGPWMGRVLDLEQELSDLLGRKVDLVMISALRNKWFRREAAKTRTVVYDASEVAEVA